MSYRDATKLIENRLPKNWHDELVYYYGLTAQKKTIAQLVTAEKWLHTQANNPWLLLTLGRLAKANALWGKAEHYLTLSLKQGARGETYKLLAEVLAAQGKDKQATAAYQQGLDFMLSQITTVKGKPADE